MTLPLAGLALDCRGEGSQMAPTAGIPFASGRHPDTSSFVMVSEEADTQWFAAEIAQEGPVARIVRARRAAGGMDSLSAEVDLRTLAPLSSYHVRHATQGPLIASIEYGAGFEGQARLVLESSEGRFTDNLRTPVPFLDAAQIPQSLAALDFGMPDTVTFSYIAPFEKQAVNAQLVIGGLASLTLSSGPVAAFPVTLRVSGLEERFWFADSGSHLLLRWRDVTRGITWTRAGP